MPHASLKSPRPQGRRRPASAPSTRPTLWAGALLCLLALPACGPSEPDSTPSERQDGSGGTLQGEAPPAPSSTAPQALSPLSTLPACRGSVLAAFDLEEVAPPLAESEGYQVPDPERLEVLERSIRTLLAGEAGTAATHAAIAGYTLCRGTGAEAALVLWRPPAGEGQATFALRTGRARPALIEAPHPLHDQDTLPESVLLFDRLQARALIASGTHRCANAAPSGCTGTTGSCGGGSAAFRASDMAHTDGSAYHTAHRVLSEHFASDWVFGIHGMGDPGISVSDGTVMPTDPESPSARVATALAAAFRDVTTCNAFGTLPRESRMCGTTDVQGRHLNGTMDACTDAATSSSRRFVHLEQSRAVRDQPERVAEALDRVVPRAR